MYDSPRRGRGFDRATSGAHARQVPAGVHEGTRRDFLRRHEQEAAQAAAGGTQAKRKFVRRLHDKIADERNLMLAMDHLRANGPKAVGPNGLDLRRLSDAERWDLARTLSGTLTDDSYRPGPSRTIRIPKAGKPGTRPIQILNADDQVVQRAIVQILQPVLEPTFDALSLGYRPGYGREYALAQADSIARRENRREWIVEDLKDAFTSVPQQRELDILRRLGLDDKVAQLTGTIMSAYGPRGLPQGGSLSPLLMDVYAQWSIHRALKQRNITAPVIRVGDDLLILGASEQEAHQAYDALEEVTRPAGLSLKGSRATSIRSMQAGATANWLGYLISYRDDRPRVDISQSNWRSLASKLEECHKKANAPLGANRTILGWLDQLGPCLPTASKREVFSRIRKIAGELAFDEVPSHEELKEWWERSHVRWTRMQRVVLLRSCHRLAGGSACRHRESADDSRGGGAPDNNGAPPPSLTTSNETYVLYTDGSCLPNSRLGGWAFILESPDGRELIRADSASRTTSSRMELTAVFRGLQSLDAPASVRVVSDSTYVTRGISEWLANWKQAGWRGSKGRIKNLRLWQRLDEQLQRHDVTVEWVRSHAGHQRNEQCDLLAREAAIRHTECDSDDGRKT